MDVPQAAPSTETPAPTPTPAVKPNARVFPKWALILAIASGVGLIALLFWYLLFYRKKKWSEEEDGAEIDFDFDDDDE